MRSPLAVSDRQNTEMEIRRNTGLQADPAGPIGLHSGGGATKMWLTCGAAGNRNIM